MQRITRSIIIFSLVAGIALISNCATLTSKPLRKISSTLTPAFEIQGHRGARAVRAENSLRAFEYALSIGVDTLEMDLHATKDNVLVVTHDPYLNRDVCRDSEGKKIKRNIKVMDLTLAELQTYSCGRVNPRFPKQITLGNEKIPSFIEVLSWLRDSSDPLAKTVLLNVETKSEVEHPDYTPSPEAFVSMILEAARSFGVLERLTLQSFDFRTLVIAKRLEPNLSLSALIEDRPAEPLISLAKRLQVNIISPYYKWLTADDVRSLQAEKVRVIPWTVNDRTSWEKLFALGVDGMISDDPEPLIQFRAEVK